MKRTFQALLALLLAVMMLVGCGNQAQSDNDKDDPENTLSGEHTGNTQPTAPNENDNEHNGETDNNTQPSAPSEDNKEHNGEADTGNQQASVGLAYGFSDDGTCCSVIGIGTCKDTDIIVPGEYQGLPVMSVSFEDCASLTSITILEGVSNIYYINDCTNLKSISLPSTITYIEEDETFLNCPSLEHITVAPGNPNYHSNGDCLIETSTNTLILGCKNSIIPTDGSVTKIGQHAFRDCASLTSIMIPDSVTDIGKNAFWGCTGLESITIADSVTHIQKGAFTNCTNLKDVTLSNSLRSISDSVFKNCTSLVSITIPESITRIYEFAFAGCTSLENITIPKSVIAIYGRAFEGCTSLKSITIPDSVSATGSEIFLNCTSLSHIYCEANNKPNEWSNQWLDNDGVSVYWGKEWDYVDGVPTPTK